MTARRWRRSLAGRVDKIVNFRNTPTAIWTTTGAGRINVSANQQAYGVLGQVNYGGDFQAIQAAFPSIGVNKTAQFVTLGWTQYYKFINQTNATIDLMIFEATARYDIPFFASMSLANLLSNSYVDEQSGGTLLGLNAPFASPYWAHRLTTAYKLRRKKFRLLGGQQCSYLLKARPMRVHIDRYFDTAANQILVGERGKYKLCFYLVQGSPCNDAATAANVGMSQAALDYLTVEKVRVSYNQFQNYKVYNYRTTIPGSAAVPTIMSVAQDAGVAVNVA